jgi:hypothetical protein
MLVRLACFAALGGFLFGYDLGLISGAIMYIHDDFNTSEEQEEAIVGATKFGVSNFCIHRPCNFIQFRITSFPLPF